LREFLSPAEFEAALTAAAEYSVVAADNDDLDVAADFYDYLFDGLLTVAGPLLKHLLDHEYKTAGPDDGSDDEARNEVPEIDERVVPSRPQRLRLRNALAVLGFNDPSARF
jgi:hypothetical protein